MKKKEFGFIPFWLHWRFLVLLSFTPAPTMTYLPQQKQIKADSIFMGQKRMQTTKEQIFILIPTTIFGHGILFIQKLLIFTMPFCRQRSQNL